MYIVLKTEKFLGGKSECKSVVNLIKKTSSSSEVQNLRPGEVQKLSPSEVQNISSGI